MSTLLKAHLLKTDDPFIMLKCFVEDILKEQGLTWDDLVNALKREAGSKKLYDKLPFSPELKNGLKELMEIDSGFFGRGKLIEQKITRRTPITIEIDPESEGEDWLAGATLRGKATSGKRVRQDPRLIYPKKKKKDGKIIPIEEGGGYETPETEETVEVPPKGAPKISGRPKGAPKTTTELGDDPMHPNVREKNIRNFINALKLSPEFKEHPALTKVIKGLQNILDVISRREDKKVPEKSRGIREEGKKRARKITRTGTLKEGINYLNKIKTLVSSITDDDIMDFEGKMIYSPSLMKKIYNLLPKPENIVRLKAHANGEVIEDLKKLYGLDNKDLESVKNRRGKNYPKIMERLNLSKDEEKDFSERIKKLEEIRDTLSKEVEYVTLEGVEKRPLYEAIIDVRQSKTNVELIDDIAEHKNANEMMSNLWKDLKKFGGRGLMAKLLKEPRVRERMGLPPTDKEISEKETQRIMEQVEEGKEVTWGN